MDYKLTKPIFLAFIITFLAGMPFEARADCIEISLGTITNATCGNNDGTMQFSVNLNNGDCNSLGCSLNGASFKFQIDNGPASSFNPANTVNATNLSAGNHELKVFLYESGNPNHCIMVTQSFMVDGQGLTLTISNVTPSDCNNNNGSFTVGVSGGTAPYTVTANGIDKTINQNGGTTTFGGLSPNTNYTIDVEDDLGCTGTATVQIGPTTPVTVQLMSLNPVSCKGGDDGSIKVTTPNAGTPGYTYGISPNANFNIGPNEYTGMAAGVYTVTVTYDQTGCKGTSTITVTEPDSIKIQATPQSVTCKGLTDGKIFVTVMGGNGGYMYAWSGTTATTKDLTNLSPGMYSLTVTDSKSCMASLSNISISDASNVELDIDFDSPVNSGQSPDIRPMVDPSGYYFEWRILESGNVNFSPNPGSINTIMEGDAIGHSLSLEDNRSIGSVIYEIQTIKLNNPDCIARIDTVEILVKPNLDDTPFITEIYTPNGDGQNDEWLIIMPPDVDGGDYTLFNRLGGKVFEADINTLWDGTGCPDGPYFYVLRYTQGGEEKIIKGVVTIIRTSGR